MKIHGLIIDPQNSFCYPGIAGSGVDTNSDGWKQAAPLLENAMGKRSFDELVQPGELFVPGADKDMQNLATMILRLSGKIDDLHVTLDSHRKVDQAHPLWWKRPGDGSHPDPFTILGVVNDKVVRMEAQADGSMKETSDEFITQVPSLLHSGGVTGKGSKGYLEALKAAGRYPHIIWPEHCKIGTFGHNIFAPLMEAIEKWESRFATVNYVTKGSNMFTEHYSGVSAEVPDPRDPSTQLNTSLIKTLEEVDILFVAGEARSHCIANSMRDIVSNFSDPKYAQKIVLLEDCMSDVTGFESWGEDFMKEMISKGVKTDTSVNFLS